jgi:hypothetical protein
MKNKFKIIILLLFYSIVLNGATITSISNGDWNSNTTWSDNITPTEFDDVIIDNNDIITINVDDSVNASELWLGNNSVINIYGILVIDSLHINNNATLNVSGSLVITGGASLANNTTLTVNNTGVVDVDGNVNTGHGSTLDINGTLNISGDLNGFADIIGVGSVSVDGSVDETINDVDGNQLPIELLYFTSWRINNTVYFEWVTLSETNNQYFQILYSDNGINWIELIKINGSGTSQNEIKYSFNIDINNAYYFKLKQVDFNGQFNVFDNNILYIPENNIIQYDVYDINGYYLGKYDVNNPHLKSGLYILKDNEITLKTIKIK